MENGAWLENGKPTEEASACLVGATRSTEASLQRESVRQSHLNFFFHKSYDFVMDKKCTGLSRIQLLRLHWCGFKTSCGSDHEAKIFEEKTNATSAASRWMAKAQLTEARKSVACVEFAPRHWGLKLATGSADG